MKCVFFAGEFAGIFVCVLDGHLPISFLPASVCLKFLIVLVRTSQFSLVSFLPIFKC